MGEGQPDDTLYYLVFFLYFFSHRRPMFTSKVLQVGRYKKSVQVQLYTKRELKIRSSARIRGLNILPPDHALCSSHTLYNVNISV